ncbi:Exportin-1, repeat 2 [Dillenia turbinata]|uniref:Exportin-1, repeat 2 n=1 Tax=Dillenia turbinata TaxID=194707 RepID=A0AAN8UXY8_9MAGN
MENWPALEIHALAKASPTSLSFLLNDLVVKDTPCIGSSRLIGHLIQSYPFPMLEHVSWLKELLDCFIFMHYKAAASLVTVILPLIKFSRDLLNYTILVVRKAMFGQEDAVHLAAINAIISHILINTQLKSNGPNPFQDTSSQASCSQQADKPYNKGVGLSQEGKVKEVLYNGLVKLVLVDPSVVRPIFDFLCPHFLCIYKELRLLMICRMAKLEEVLIIEDENGNIDRKTMKDNDVLVQYKVFEHYLRYVNVVALDFEVLYNISSWISFNYAWQVHCRAMGG